MQRKFKRVLGLFVGMGLICIVPTMLSLTSCAKAQQEIVQTFAIVINSKKVDQVITTSSTINGVADEMQYKNNELVSTRFLSANAQDFKFQSGNETLEIYDNANLHKSVDSDGVDGANYEYIYSNGCKTNITPQLMFNILYFKHLKDSRETVSGVTESNSTFSAVMTSKNLDIIYTMQGEVPKEIKYVFNNNSFNIQEGDKVTIYEYDKNNAIKNNNTIYLTVDDSGSKKLIFSPKDGSGAEILSYNLGNNWKNIKYGGKTLFKTGHKITVEKSGVNWNIDTNNFANGNTGMVLAILNQDSKKYILDTTSTKASATNFNFVTHSGSDVYANIGIDEGGDNGMLLYSDECRINLTQDLFSKMFYLQFLSDISNSTDFTEGEIFFERVNAPFIQNQEHLLVSTSIKYDTNKTQTVKYDIVFGKFSSTSYHYWNITTTKYVGDNVVSEDKYLNKSMDYGTSYVFNQRKISLEGDTRNVNWLELKSHAYGERPSADWNPEKKFIIPSSTWSNIKHPTPTTEEGTLTIYPESQG